MKYYEENGASVTIRIVTVMISLESSTIEIQC